MDELRNGHNNNHTPNTSNPKANNPQHTTSAPNNNNHPNTNNTTQGGCSYKTFMSCGPHSFAGTEGPVGLTRWFKKLESVFRISRCRDTDRTQFASSYDQAYEMPWEDLKQRMVEEYCPYTEIMKMERELRNLKLVGTDSAGYNKRFFELALMCPSMVTPERRKIILYVKGLTENIRSGVTSSKPKTIQEAIEMTSELLDQIEQGGKAPMSNEARSSDHKRKWNNNSDKNYSQKFNKKPNTSKGNTTAPNTNFGYKGKFKLCNKCNSHHPGDWRIFCDKCNKSGHTAKECKAGSRNCFKCGKPGHFMKDCPNAKKNVEPAKGRAFNINSNEAHDDPKLVMSTFLLDNHHAYVLFDSGADRSFVSKDFCHNIKNPVSSLENLYSIELGNGNLMKANRIYRGCTLNLVEKSFSIDVIPIQLGSFDLVVGMDWLSDNRAEIVCDQKAIHIPIVDSEPLMVYRERSCMPLHFINCLKVQKCIRKGCLAMLVHVSKTEPKVKKLEDVPIVRDFPDIFLEELPGLPLHRDVEFQIDLMPGAAPVARAPYRLAPSELQELSSQLQELLDKGFIRPKREGARTTSPFDTRDS
ncbi:uncharacterized protein [Rutidosis leptorrhynchoides]|uniref:uncharacterized protein n=1 Tax=Rutidosis leptorrhynchoides TaxID=125765 RepID=UPI003A994910